MGALNEQRTAFQEQLSMDIVSLDYFTSLQKLQRIKTSSRITNRRYLVRKRNIAKEE